MALEWNSALVIGLLLVSTLWQSVRPASLPEDPYYTAGVVEFRPADAAVGNSTQQLEDNLAAYEEIIASHQAADADILVFPEGSLNSNADATFVPDAEHEAVIPCTEANAYLKYHALLIRLSCAARQVAKYVVINLTEKENCTANAAHDPRPCAANGLNIFNTNVVFDREGRVISRYRKVNLYGEPKNTTYVPEFGIFETDFGVRFGHFICFDILFYTPAQEMVYELGITDFIFPSMWFSQLPFLTSVQFHAAWSYGNDVNFLAAGVSNPQVGSTGSGIYAGKKGALLAVINPDQGQRQVHVAKVPKRVRPVPPARAAADTCSNSTHSKYNRQKRGLNAANVRLKRDYLELYESVALNLQEGTQLQKRVCYQSFCCQFDLRWRQLNATAGSQYYSYRLGAYEGWRKEAAADTNQLKNCALFACIGADIMDCGKTFPADAGFDVQPQVAFERIQIEANFSTAKHSLLMPNSLQDDLFPLPIGNFEWHVAEERAMQRVRYTLNTSTSNLLAFSIYGNYYDGVGECDGKGGGGGGVMVTSSLLPLVVVVLLSWFY